MTTPTNSTNQANSRYVQGGLTDQFPNRAGWWDEYTIPTATDDITYTIPNQYNLRPDLVAKFIYNQVTLMWLVLQYNNIIDINTEFITGTVLTLPSQRRVLLSILTNAPGGNPIST